MDKRFSKMLEVLFHHEGILSDDPVDAGGLTKYGISQRAYPKLDIRSLTKEDAALIYHKDYYMRAKAHRVYDDEVAHLIFDIAVNSGIRRSGTLTQLALLCHGHNVSVDGIIGKNTLKAINAEGKALLTTLISERVAFYKNIVARKPEQNRFIKGWLRRAYSFAPELKRI